jgi:hypothetical protein
MWVRARFPSVTITAARGADVAHQMGDAYANGREH